MSKAKIIFNFTILYFFPYHSTETALLLFFPSINNNTSSRFFVEMVNGQKNREIANQGNRKPIRLATLILLLKPFELVGVIRDIGYAFWIVLFNNLLCEVLARCAFSLFCISFIPFFHCSTLFPKCKRCASYFLTHTLFYKLRCSNKNSTLYFPIN